MQSSVISTFSGSVATYSTHIPITIRSLFAGRYFFFGISGSALAITTLALMIFTNLAPIYVIFYNSLAALTFLSLSCCFPRQSRPLRIDVPDTPHSKQITIDTIPLSCRSNSDQ